MGNLFFSQQEQIGKVMTDYEVIDEFLFSLSQEDFSTK